MRWGLGLLITCFATLLAGIGLVQTADAQSGTNAPLPTPYDYFRPSTNAAVNLSPNGSMIAYITRDHRKHCIDRYGQTVALSKKTNCKDKKRKYRSLHTLRVYDLDNNKLIKVLPMPENVYVSWIEWASDRRVLAALRQASTISESGNSYSLGGSRVVSFDISAADGDIVPMFENQKSVARHNRHMTSVTSMLPKDPDHIIMPASKGGDLDLWKVNVNTGAAQRIGRGKRYTFYWYTDADGAPTLRFDCSNVSCRKINVYGVTQGQNYDPKKPDDIKWEKIKSFKTKPDDEQKDYDFWPVAPTDNPAQFYVISNEDTDARSAVKIYDLEKKAYVKTVFEHPRFDVSGAITDASTGEYAGAWYYEDRLNFNLVNTKMQKHYKALNGYFDNKQNVQLFGFNADVNYALVYADGPENPGAYFVYNFKTYNVDFLFLRNQNLPETLGAKTDILNIPTRDGQNITGYLSYPKGKTTSATPLIVMPHGGPEARDTYTFDQSVAFLTDRGYQVLRVNFRGSKGYGRAFAKAGYRQWGRLMQDDVTDAVKYVHGRGKARADNTCIVGYSYGGYVALQGAVATPELYKCVVSGGGVSDLIAFTKEKRKVYGKDSDTFEYWQKSIGDPKENKTELETYSPINHAAKINAPVLIVHGVDDEIVDFNQAKNMVTALKKAGNPPEFLELEGETHSNWYLRNEILYHETLEKFLGKHLRK